MFSLQKGCFLRAGLPALAVWKEPAVCQDMWYSCRIWQRLGIGRTLLKQSGRMSVGVVVRGKAAILRAGFSNDHSAEDPQACGSPCFLYGCLWCSFTELSWVETRNLGFWGTYWDTPSCWIAWVHPSHPEAAPCADFCLVSVALDSLTREWQWQFASLVFMICFV